MKRAVATVMICNAVQNVKDGMAKVSLNSAAAIHNTDFSSGKGRDHPHEHTIQCVPLVWDCDAVT